MTYTSSLNTVHKQGLFGDHENKKENELIKPKEDYLNKVKKGAIKLGLY